MPSFGDKLRKEREKRKITLEDISTSTKIGTRMLQALEEEKFNQLPGGIFNKGFVRAYARVVGLDEDQTVADYLQASGDAPPVKPEIDVRENTRDNTRKKVPRDGDQEASNHLETRVEATSRQLPWGIFAVALLIIALALSFWSRRRHEQERLAHPLSISEVTSLPDTTTSSATGSATPPSSVSAKSNSATTPSSANIQKEKPASSSPIPFPGEFTVVIHARDESWLSVTADGKSAVSELLSAGSDRSIQARKQVVVKAGNSGGLDLRLNGKKLDFRGDFGEVKTVTIGPAGVTPNSPAPLSNP